MSYGLKGKVRQMVMEMNALRDPGKEKIGRDVSLRDHVAENFKDGSGKPLSVKHLYHELGINEHSTTIHQIMEDEDTRFLMAEVMREGAKRGMGLAQREQMAAMQRRAAASFAPITGEQAGGQRFVTPDVFLDPVNRGAVQNTFYPDLVIREIPVAQPKVTVPKIDLSDAALAASNEAATIEEGSISYSTKDVTILKRGKAIKITDEAIMFSSLSLLQIYMQDFGRLLGNTLNNDAVNAIQNGDQADGSEAAAVVGVASTGAGLTYADLVTVAIRLGLIGQTGVQVIANETMANLFLNLAEIKNRYLGSPLVPVQIKTPFQLPTELYVSSQVAANKIIINDPSSSLVQLTAMPLKVETERIAMKQLTGTIMSIYTGFAKIQRKGSVVVNQAVAFSGNGFPSYMTPA